MTSDLWSRMCRLAARWLVLARRKREQAIDPNRVPPLVRLMDDAEPPPDLLPRIEAQLDIETDQEATKPPSHVAERLRFAAMGLLVGVTVGAGAVHLTAGRLPFHAAGIDGRSAGVLGHISVHGGPLHLGIQEFCRDAHHLAISITATPDPTADGAQPTNFTRKFLIPCNF